MQRFQENFYEIICWTPSYKHISIYFQVGGDVKEINMNHNFIAYTLDLYFEHMLAYVIMF